MDDSICRGKSFPELIRAVRRGDDLAAETLLRRYEPELRIMARVRLTDPSLSRVMDSIDICQSVMAQFFVRAASGELELETPQQLKALLAKMLKNKVTDHARRQKAGKRDARRVAATPLDEIGLPDGADTPSQIVAARELLDKFHSNLTDEERQLVERRKAGASWEDLAQEQGDSPEALRKRHARALRRAAKEIGFDDL